MWTYIVGVSILWLLQIKRCQCFSVNNNFNTIAISTPYTINQHFSPGTTERARHETADRKQFHTGKFSVLRENSVSRLNGVPFFADSLDDEETKTSTEKETVTAKEDEDVTSKTSVMVDVKPISGSPSSIHNAAVFMVESFWLGSPLNLLDGENLEVSDSTKKNLIDAQETELMDTYGERMGKRVLPTCLLMAYDKEDSKNILGMVGIETTLLDTEKDEKFFRYEKAEETLKNTIASLGPSQRREYKNKSCKEISAELLSPEVGVVACLSNLSVSPNARRKGIAEKLCREAENVIQNEWGFDNMYLKVEKANTGAKYLYRSKLNFTTILSYDASALRVDSSNGSFVSKNVETVIMGKEF